MRSHLRPPAPGAVRVREGSYRQTVVLCLHGAGQIKQLHVLPGTTEHRDGWRVSMAEPDPAEATAVARWVPKTPGELGSTMIR
ncbi:hypothetical protein [Streptomyces sp. NPDC058613]|uniref:hypothetical protein n=1 Tax=unclassified Streptomyces TaxID=2593676 RepID=UPI00365ABD75